MIYRAYEPLGHPNCNPGDHVVERGARKLLNRLGLCIEDPEILYVVGTPWLWHRCAESEKYASLRTALEQPYRRKVALGIGSCFAWQKKPDLGAGDALAIWSGFDQVICRDEIAATLTGGVCLPCPSIWAIDGPVEKGRGSLAVDCDPWHPEYLTEKWIPKNYDWLNYKQGTFHSQDDIDRLLEKLLSYSRIVSKRIHAIMPISPFRKTKVVPSDSRALTAVRVGITPDSWSNAARIMEQREGDWLQGYKNVL